MVVVRPVRLEDLDQVRVLVQGAGHGLTSLPKDDELLRRKVVESHESFQRPVDRPRGESYLLVLEDRDTGRLAGTSGIVSKVGGFEPFYAYRVETHVHQSEALRVRKEIRCLHLVAEHSGPCEIGSLFLDAAYRRHGAGRLLSLSRFLLMAAAPHRFEREVIAEMRGVVDEAGRSPFWEAVGRHFFDIDYPKADYLSVKDKRFIAELLPTHPIYIPLLPPEAQAVIGQVHEQTRPALALLEQEGFRYLDMVDLFDAGPIVGCPRGEIRTVRECRRARVAAVRDGPEPPGAPWLLAVWEPEFRACLGPAEVAGDEVVLTAECAAALGAEPGQAVLRVPARAPRGEEAR
ncbi:MAG: arginine N-succinyltransferase [Deferrisomatales bacterium]